MQNFQITLSGDVVNIAQILKRGLGITFGSLNGSLTSYFHLVEGNTIAGPYIAEEAVPEPEDPHPQRAEVRWDDREVEFTTPGGVMVVIRIIDEDTIVLELDFGRDSTFAVTQLATAMLSEAMAHTGLSATTMASLTWLAHSALQEEAEEVGVI